MREFTVRLIWDDDERVWHSQSDELGLTLESGSFDALVERVKIAAPEMVELNFGYTGEFQLVLEMAQRTVSIRAMA